MFPRILPSLTNSVINLLVVLLAIGRVAGGSVPPEGRSEFAVVKVGLLSLVDISDSF